MGSPGLFSDGFPKRSMAENGENGENGEKGENGENGEDGEDKENGTSYEIGMI